MYAIALEFGGMTVRCSSTIAEALALIGRERPDLVITDLYLAGESGLDLAHRLTTDPAYVSLPVVLLTGDTRADLPARARAAGCAALAIKPVMPDALADLINATVASVKRRVAPLPWMVHLLDEPFARPGHPILGHRGFLPIEELPK